MMISEEELQRRKTRILHKSFQLFCKNGVDKTTIEEIAKASGVSVNSIYRYFKTKVELVMQTSDVLWLEVVNELTGPILRHENYEAMNGCDQVGLLLKVFFDLYREHADYIRFSYDFKLFLLRHSVLLTENQYEEILKPLEEYYISAIEKGKADGSIAIKTDSHVLYNTIWGLMRGFVVKMVLYDGILPSGNPWKKEQFDLACAIILSALRNGV